MSKMVKLARSFNLEAMERAAKSLGYDVKHDTSVNGYWSNMAKAKLVIKGKEGYDIGFNEHEILMDRYMGYTDKMLEELLPQYYVEVAGGKFFVEKIEKKDNKLRMVLQTW